MGFLKFSSKNKMGSKLQQFQEARSESKSEYNVANYNSIPSKLQRQKFFQENKKSIEKYEGLKKEAEEIQKGKMSEDNFSEEDYEKVYNEMKEELKSFFKSPTELKEEKSGRIASNTTAVENEIATATQKKQEAYAKYKEKLAKIEKWYDEKTSSTKNAEKRAKYREQKREKEEKAENDYEEEKAYYNGYIEKLQWGSSKLKSGNDYTYEAVKKYAHDYGRYEEKKEKERNKYEELKEKYADKIETVQNSATIAEYLKNYSQLPSSLKSSFPSPTSSKIKSYFNEKSNYEDLAKQGLKAVYSGGKLTGYEDAVLKMSYSADAYKNKFKEEREKYNINYNPEKNQISWQEKEETPTEETASAYGNIDITNPELLRKLQEYELDLMRQKVRATTSPIHETYNPEMILTNEELKEAQENLKKAYQVKEYTGEAKTISGDLGNFINLDVNIPVGFGVAKGLTYNPYEFEQTLINYQKENTITGELEAKNKEFIKKYGDAYGNVNNNMISEEQAEQYNKDLEELKALKEKSDEMSWWSGVADAYKYYGTKGLQLINPESVGELGTEMGAIYGGYKALPYVMGGLNQFNKAYPTVSKLLEAGFFGKNLYDIYEGYKEKDWRQMGGGMAFATLQTIPYALQAINKLKWGGMHENPIKAKEFEQEKRALEKAYKSLFNEKRELGELRLDRVKEIVNDKKAHQIIKDFIKSKKLTVGGTTGIETLKTGNGNQVTLTRQPRDLELFGNAKWLKDYADDLARQLKNAGFDVTKEGNAVIFNEIGGHGVNFQNYQALNLDRYTGKIYSTADGILVADPVGIAYNKVFDLLKRTRPTSEKALQLLKDNPEAYEKSLVNGWVYVRYPKDSTGALDTAQQVLNGLIENYKANTIPIYQETKLAKSLRAKEFINPYLKKIAEIEAKAIPYYYTGKTPSILAGYLNPEFESAIYNNFISMMRNKRGFYGTSYNIPYPSYKDVNPIYATGIYGTPEKYNLEGYTPMEIKEYPKTTEYTPTKTTEYPITITEYPPEITTKYPTEYSPTYPPEYTPAIKTGYTPTIISKKEKTTGTKRGSEENKFIEAYQPIYYNEEGNAIEGRLFPNIIEATAEGFDETDNSPLEKFRIRKVITKQELLNRHLGTTKGYKFKSKGKLYIEKVPYRKDTKGEKSSFNIMPYVFGNREYS